MIYLPTDITALLREHYKKQQEMKGTAAHWANLDLVFCTPIGGYLVPGTVRSQFEKLLRLAGLKHMKFHGLRHNASLILDAWGLIRS